MNRAQILESLSYIFSDIMDVEPNSVTEFTSPDNVDEWTSMKHIALISAIEETFDLKLTANEMSDMLNVEIILDIIEGNIYGKPIK